MPHITVIGGGLAGSAAAIEARSGGAEVTLWEQSRLPRHKVCGEFLSPEAAPVLERLGVLAQLEAEGPARVRRYRLVLAGREKSARLDEPAYGISRFVLDRLLMDRALACGAHWRNERAVPPYPAPAVLACGRQFATRREQGVRQFGFKAHFRGPQDDAVELYFFDGCYVGINSVENGLTNVCGLAPETALRRWSFDIDALMAHHPPLRDRLTPLERVFPAWLKTGPLVYRNQFAAERDASGLYPAGDVLSFVDPFTGSGMLCALISGSIAGEAAARGDSVAGCLRTARSRLESPYRVSTVLRYLAAQPWTRLLLPLAPGSALFRWTRPRWGLALK